MKKTIILLILLVFSVGESFSQKKTRRESPEEVTTEQPGDPMVGSSFNRSGIYEGQISASTEALEVLDGVYMIVASLEDAAKEALEEPIVVGSIKGLIVPDYIKDPGSNNIVAYSFVVEQKGEDNKAIRYFTFDRGIVDLFSNMALNDDGFPNEIYLYGITMDIKEASLLKNVDLVPRGEPIENYFLVGLSLENISKPGIVLVSTTLLRSAEETVQKYSPAKGSVREIKVSLLGYEEMKEGTLMEEKLLPYLQTKEFLVVRSIWSRRVGSSGTDSAWKDTDRSSLSSLPQEGGQKKSSGTFRRPD